MATSWDPSWGPGAGKEEEEAEMKWLLRELPCEEKPLSMSIDGWLELGTSSEASSKRRSEW